MWPSNVKNTTLIYLTYTHTLTHAHYFFK